MTKKYKFSQIDNYYLREFALFLDSSDNSQIYSATERTFCPLRVKLQKMLAPES